MRMFVLMVAIWLAAGLIALIGSIIADVIEEKISFFREVSIYFRHYDDEMVKIILSGFISLVVFIYCMVEE